MNWVTRITLTIVLLSGVAYLGYAKTRSAAVTPAVAPSQHQIQQQQKASSNTPALPTKPPVETVSAASPNMASTQAPADRKKLDQEIIARAKAAKVSNLQKGMPEQTFGDWLQDNFSDKATISWEVNDCGENDGSGHQEELPVCAEADLHFPKGELIGISVAVASVQVKTEVHTFGPPGLFSSFFTNDNKKFCSTSLDRIANWAKDTSQEPPCSPVR